MYTYWLLYALLNLDHTNSYQLFQNNTYASADFDYSGFVSDRVVPIYIGSQRSHSTAEVGEDLKVRGIHKLTPYIVRQPLLYELAARYQEWRVQQAVSADVLHLSEYFFPRRRKQATVVTVYDITTVRVPHLHTSANIRVHARKLAFARDRADAVITISNSTKRDLIERIGIPESRISVIPGAARPIFHEPPAPLARETLREKYGIDRPYILFVGPLARNKNIDHVLDAYATLIGDGTAADTLLVVVGSHRGRDDRIAGRLEDKKLAAKIRWPGFIPDDDLRDLYANAECFVFPSFYEGFGLPILEAMATGCPVITSTTAAMPEVAGDAALLVDPHSVDELISAIRRLLTNHALRGQLTRAGRERARQFSWQQAAADTLGVYEAVFRRT